MNRSSVLLTRRLACLAALGCLAGLCSPGLAAEAATAAPTDEPVELKPGDLFPDLRQFPLEGRLPDELKGHVRVVDFWASWCAPCKDTFPAMEELHVRFQKQGLVIIAINVDKSRTAMTEFLKDHPVTFTVLRDSRKELVSTLRLPSLPSTFILDREGRVHSICKGFRNAESRRKAVKEIEELLKAAAPAPRP
ncbi:MAG TPA: TlpA disulfide reductase family protein [Candidatus Limnocylindria bacterium]|nr:TlpA disulfide reductase family protein [Candidatus Limnocylindria bacterium]